MKNKLARLRKKYRVTQKELAQNLSVTRQTISVIENGHYCPTLTLAFKIARFFDVPIEDIFIYEE